MEAKDLVGHDGEGTVDGCHLNDWGLIQQGRVFGAAIREMLQIRTLPLRAPVVPLVTVDPFFSVWSRADHLADVYTTHWAGRDAPLAMRVNVDGQDYRLLGCSPGGVPALPQASCEVRPTQTVCLFTNGVLEAELRFSTPMMPEDLDVFSRPATYVTFRVRMKDGRSRAVRVSFEIGGEVAGGDDPSASVAAEVSDLSGNLKAVRLGLAKQTPLNRSGDKMRADWGYAWLVGPVESSASVAGLALPAREQRGTVTVDLAGLSLFAGFRGYKLLEINKTISKVCRQITSFQHFHSGQFLVGSVAVVAIRAHRGQAPDPLVGFQIHRHVLWGISSRQVNGVGLSPSPFGKTTSVKSPLSFRKQSKTPQNESETHLAEMKKVFIARE